MALIMINTSVRLETEKELTEMEEKQLTTMIKNNSTIDQIVDRFEAKEKSNETILRLINSDKIDIDNFIENLENLFNP